MRRNRSVCAACRSVVSPVSVHHRLVRHCFLTFLQVPWHFIISNQLQTLAALVVGSGCCSLELFFVDLASVRVPRVSVGHRAKVWSQLRAATALGPTGRADVTYSCRTSTLSVYEYKMANTKKRMFSNMCCILYDLKVLCLRKYICTILFIVYRYYVRGHITLYSTALLKALFTLSFL